MKEVLELDIKTGEAPKTLRDIAQELRQIEDSMAGLESGSDAFREAAHKAGELQHQMQEIREAVHGASADFGDMVGNVAKAGAGITGAFQAVSGALNLMGVESEDVTKAIQKMQSVMALTQGLSAIDNGIKAFKKFTTAVSAGSSTIKKALISTGFGALAIVIGSLIANWKEFSEAIGISSKQMEKFGDMTKGVINAALKAIGGLGKALSRLLRGDFDGAKEAAKEAMDFSANYAEGVRKSEEQREKAHLKARQEEYAKFVEKRQQQLDTERSKAEATIKDEQKRNEELIRIEQERLKLYKQGSKEYYDQLKTIQDLEKQESDRKQQIADAEAAKKEKDEADAKKKADDDRKKAEEDINIRLEQNKRLEQSDRERVQKQIELETERLALMKENTLEYEQQLTKIKELADSIKEETKDLTELRLNTAEKFASELADAAAGFDQLSNGVNASFVAIGHTISETTKAVKVFGDENANAANKAAAGLQVASSAFAGLGNILNEVAAEQDENSKEGFEKQKKLQIGASVMSMLSGMLGAFSTSITQLGPIAGSIVGAALSAAIGTMGGIQIAKIKSTTFDGGGASSGAASANLSNIARTANTPVQMTQDIQGAETIGAIKDSKVYVTETDITNTQKKVDLAETESVF